MSILDIPVQVAKLSVDPNILNNHPLFENVTASLIAQVEDKYGWVDIDSVRLVHVDNPETGKRSYKLSIPYADIKGHGA